jgi:hypothetical protein
MGIGMCLALPEMMGKLPGGKILMKLERVGQNIPLTTPFQVSVMLIGLIWTMTVI